MGKKTKGCKRACERGMYVTDMFIFCQHVMSRENYVYVIGAGGFIIFTIFVFWGIEFRIVVHHSV